MEVSQRPGTMKDTIWQRYVDASPHNPSNAKMAEQNGEFVWGNLFDEIATIAHKKGYLNDPTPERLSATEVDAMQPKASWGIGTNSRGVSIRGKKLLGWKPVKGPISDELPDIIDEEARLLGLSKGHAAIAAGED
jgi:hypothetical protein